MSYTKPQVEVFQEFAIIPVEVTEPLRAHISGPNADLHRYSDADEKETILLGAYDPMSDVCYTWPGRHPGGLVDIDYVKLFIDNALLLYLEDTIGLDTTITPVSGRTNWIQSDVLSFKSNGVAYPRSDVFLDRDVHLGDTVYLRSVSDDDDCIVTELWTYVTGFASETVAAEVEAASEDDDNQETTAASISIEKTGGVDNCILATVVDPSDYDGLLDGDVEEEYTIEVIKSSVAGCNAARLRITSASGHDDVAEVQPSDMGDETDIGTRGVQVIFTNDGSDSCSSAASAGDAEPTEFVVGQKWVVTVTQEFEKVLALSGGDYTGDVNDTYIVTVTKGGLWENLPEITINTVKGLDFSGPTEVTDGNIDVPIGSHGVTIRFFGSEGGDSDVSLGLDEAAGLRKGDRFYITCVSSAAGPVRKLILKHDLPAAMLTATDMDLRLYIKANIEVAIDRASSPPLVNYYTEDTQICVLEGIQAYHATWTDNGVAQPLEVKGGQLYAEYREWLPTLIDAVGSIQDVADLGDIPGPTHPDNPLKYGVSKALENSNGTGVKYTAVEDPSDVDSWIAVLHRITGRDDLYNLVPLTFNREVQDLYDAHADAESSPTANNWKGAVLALQSRSTKALVNSETSSDSEVVLATLKDNPQATNTQYTLLQVPGGNGQFITNGVAAADVVRYIYEVDGFGVESYTEFLVDDVLSEDALLLTRANDTAINVPQKVEIWHTLTKDEISEEMATTAGSFSDRRVVAVWPDVAGTAGTNVPGYFVAAALAGEISGVMPHQGLTNVELAGFDDLSKSFEFFNATQLNRMAEAGVWIVTEDRDGTPITRHALTTDNLDLNRREEMIRRNVDSMSYTFLRRLKPFIGRTNVTPSMLKKLRYEIGQIIDFFKSNGFTDELGSQLIDGSIRILQVMPLAADHVEIVLDLVVPAPMNNIELHLVI